MRRFTVNTMLVVVGLVLVVSVLGAQADDPEKLFLNALSEKDPQIKLEKLVRYEQQYGKQAGALSKLLYANLVLAAYPLKDYEKTVNYGGKALALEGHDAMTRMKLCLYVSTSLLLLERDVPQALVLAEEAYSHGKKFFTESADPYYRNQFVIPALKNQIVALKAGGEPDQLQSAFRKAQELYALDPSPVALQLLCDSGNQLQKAGQAEEPIAVFENLLSKRPQPEIARRLAIWLDAQSQRPKAIEYLQLSYHLDRKARTAYELAILLQADNPPLAMEYLAESFILNDPAVSPRSEEVLRQLFVNSPAAKLKPKDMEKAYEDILNAARARIQANEYPPAAPAPAAETPTPQ